MRWENCLDLLMKKDMELSAVCKMARIISRHGKTKFGFTDNLSAEVIIGAMWRYVNRSRSTYMHSSILSDYVSVYEIGKDQNGSKFGLPTYMTPIIIRHWSNPGETNENLSRV
jgi:hypothetical protein